MTLFRPSAAIVFILVATVDGAVALWRWIAPSCPAGLLTDCPMLPGLTLPPGPPESQPEPSESFSRFPAVHYWSVTASPLGCIRSSGSRARLAFPGGPIRALFTAPEYLRCLAQARLQTPAWLAWLPP